MLIFANIFLSKILQLPNLIMLKSLKIIKKFSSKNNFLLFLLLFEQHIELIMKRELIKNYQF